MNSPDVAAEDLEYEFELDEPLEKVWRALIDPKIAATWMLPDEQEPPSAALTCELVSAEPPGRVGQQFRRQGQRPGRRGLTGGALWGSLVQEDCLVHLTLGTRHYRPDARLA